MRRCLVLGGGGAYGAFQAGVLQALVQEKRRRYDAVIGTSIGALNGAFFAQVNVADQPNRANELVELWRGMRPLDVYSFSLWPALVSGGIYNTAPLKKLIYRYCAETTLLPLKVTATNASTGESIVVESNRGEDIRPWIYASASIPVSFPPVKIHGESFMDGGVRLNVPIEEATLWGDFDEIDVIVCQPEKLAAPSVVQTMGNSVTKAALVTIFALTEQATEGSLELYKNHPKVRIYRPDFVPASMTPLHFGAFDTTLLLAHGEHVGGRSSPSATRGYAPLDPRQRTVGS